MMGQSPAVLLVANDPELRERVDEALVPEGYRVVAADGEREAWRVLHHLPVPRLILLGIELSEGEAWRLVHRVLEDPMLDGIPILTLGSATRDSQRDLRAMVSVYCRA
jgi:CheY-like chemotaxis protein